MGHWWDTDRSSQPPRPAAPLEELTGLRQRSFALEAQDFLPWIGTSITYMIHGAGIYPIGSMYAIYGNIYHQYTPNVSIYIPYMDPMGIYHIFLAYVSGLIFSGNIPTIYMAWKMVKGSWEAISELRMTFYLVQLTMMKGGRSCNNT